MSTKTGISWTDHTFNPWWGCTEVSPGCDHCYARTLAERWGFNVWGPGAPRRYFDDKHWQEPLKWDRLAAAEGRRHRVFCASMADVFDAEVPQEHRNRLWALVARTPRLDWQILTKRPANMRSMLPEHWGSDLYPRGYANVWLGVSAEDQQRLDQRLPLLLRTPARVRFVSAEPLLGALDLSEHVGCYHDDDVAGGQYVFAEHATPYCVHRRELHWLIAGGESGPQARPLDPDWARGLRDQCAQAGVAFFLKQWGGPRPGGDAVLDGRLHHEFPEVQRHA
jgi:protein gp37